MDFQWLQPIVESIGGSIVNAPGGGGIIFGIVLGTAATVYFLAGRWIMRGSNDEGESDG
jgi:hypothetical protein